MRRKGNLQHCRRQGGEGAFLGQQELVRNAVLLGNPGKQSVFFDTGLHSFSDDFVEVMVRSV
jgi:hypothetical protein